MKNLKNQSGFGYFMVILIGALVLGIVVFVGFKVMNADESQDESATNPSTSQQAIQSSGDLDKAEDSVSNSNIDNDLDTTEVDQDVNDLL